MSSGLDPRRRYLLAAGVVVGLALGRPARAETEARPPLAWSVGTGCVLMLGAMAAGGGMAALNTRDRPRQTGFEVMAAGLALAPIASHAVAGEWKRAAVFAAITVPLAVTSTVLLENSRAILNFGQPIDRVPFGAAMALDLMVAGVGVADSLMAGERAHARAHLALLPVVAGRAPGLTVGGLL